MDEEELQEFKEMIKGLSPEQLEQFEARLIKTGYTLTRKGKIRIYTKPGGKVTIQPPESEET